MKSKAIHIMLLAIVSIHAFSLQHLYKLPILVLHYWEHQQRGTPVTVIEFLEMHYWGQDINDDDQERDMELPFKKADFHQTSITLFFNSSDRFTFSDFPFKIRFTTYVVNHLISAPVGSLFKPPRLS